MFPFSIRRFPMCSRRLKRAVVLLVMCFSIACGGDLEPDAVPYEGLSGGIIRILEKVIPADGTAVKWEYQSVDQGSNVLQWDGFTLQLVKVVQNGVTAISFSAKLPTVVEPVKEYRAVWPLAGYLKIGEVVGEKVSVTRWYPDKGSGEESQDSGFQDGQLSLKGENELVISFSVTDTEVLSNPAAYETGVPVGIWSFTLKKIQE